MTTKTRSLRWYFDRAVFRALLITGSIAGVVILSSMLRPAPVQHDVMDNRPHAEGSPAYVLEKMGDKCWTANQTAKVTYPGHVVYSIGDTGAKVGGKEMVSKAFDQVFENKDLGIAIYAFCR